MRGHEIDSVHLTDVWFTSKVWEVVAYILKKAQDCTTSCFCLFFCHLPELKSPQPSKSIKQLKWSVIKVCISNVASSSLHILST